MAYTVDDIQAAVAGVVDQNENTSNISTADYSLRLKFLNRRERMWSEIGRWPSLYKEYNTLTSTSSGNVTVSLPDDFRVMVSYPRIAGDEYSEIDPAQAGNYASTDKYHYVLGDPNHGYNMIVHPGTNSGQLASGASIFINYYASPASLVTSTNNVTCPNPEYLITGVIADVWEGRGDERAEAKRIEANIILQNMLEFETTPTQASDDDRIKTVEQTKYNFRLGRD